MVVNVGTESVTLQYHEVDVSNTTKYWFYNDLHSNKHTRVWSPRGPSGSLRHINDNYNVTEGLVQTSTLTFYNVTLSNAGSYSCQTLPPREDDIDYETIYSADLTVVGAHTVAEDKQDWYISGVAKFLCWRRQNPPSLTPSLPSPLLPSHFPSPVLSRKSRGGGITNGKI